jgi:hypothetical protein
MIISSETFLFIYNQETISIFQNALVGLIKHLKQTI